ncbi:MAG: C_GCAxxG_C_C family protein [Ruminococcaceae bacterium]|nr:C_GCAxxG_C_C family protein [Oscillospiraceae bacterium]
MSGYNCVQSVVLAFADDLDLDEEFLAKMSSGFGGGIGGLRGICGTVTGMIIVNNIMNGNITEDGKKEHYESTRNLVEKFEAIYETSTCSELLDFLELDADPLPRTEEYYKTRPCVRFVETAVEILEKNILK